MAIFKCKMCGGTIEFEQGETVGTCEYCGTKQTLPKLDGTKKETMYERADHFRRNNDFDKAAAVYEQILNEDNTDAESYWSLVLCRYGIEYVEDPASRKRIPTVNRTQFTSIFADEDYKSAVYYADTLQREIYEQEAKTIDDIQKGILAISQKEEPFDVFICYKESDANGRRTQDSVIATELYHELTKEGFKVFFSRITLEDKLGTAYEPYIFAALNSAKVMVVLGTKPENFNAVWVKNEWSRYLALIKNGANKMLIPAYRDMDPYDLPEEFSYLQAQDMSKLGFMQDLTRGIRKIIGEDTKKADASQAQNTQASNSSALLERAFMFLEDGEWEKADNFCEQVLNQNPKDAQAYLGKLMAELHVKKQDDLKNCDTPFDASSNYQKAVRFGDAALAQNLKDCIKGINERNENAKCERIYQSVLKDITISNTEEAYRASAKRLNEIANYKDSEALAKQCLEKAEKMKNERLAKEEAEKKEAERKAEERRIAAEKAAKKIKKTLAIVIPIVIVAIAAAVLTTKVFIPNAKYNDAVELMNNGQYAEAITAFEAINGYKNSPDQIVSCQNALKDIDYNAAVALMNDGKYDEAITAFEAIEGYKDSNEQLTEARYDNAVALMNSGKYDDAIAAFEAMDGYKDSNNQISNCENELKNIDYNTALELMNNGKCDEAITLLESMNGYNESEKIIDNYYIEKYGEELYNKVKNINVGDTYSFGKYEQDNNFSNGKEEVEWIVLEKDSLNLLLVSKYALNCQQYGPVSTDTYAIWKTCYLRTWLNDTFINETFSSDEQAMIATTNVIDDNDSNNNTNDKIFLLSVNEEKKCFTTDKSRKCSATAYAKAQGTNTDMDNDCCWWWLRSCDDWNPKHVAIIGSNGSLVGINAFLDTGAVRPAMWINLGE